MDGPNGRRIFADAGSTLYALSVGNDSIAKPNADKSVADESAYTGEPSMFDRFVCFLSGMSYTGGSEIDANGQCQVKGKPIDRTYRGR